MARERAEELVRLVADLYGAGLERVLELMHERGHLDDETLDALAGDDWWPACCWCTACTPTTWRPGSSARCEGVRPYLGSHGGDVELLEVTDEGVVRLRLLGSCDGCASSSVTLKLAVEGAIEAAAPEVTGDRGRDAERPTGERARSSRCRRCSRASAPAAPDEPGSAWEQVPELLGLASGSVAHVIVGQTRGRRACRAGTDLFAFARPLRALPARHWTARPSPAGWADGPGTPCSPARSAGRTTTSGGPGPASTTPRCISIRCRCWPTA